jgi:PTH1 family peptidyl-tRNA hydrolase
MEESLRPRSERLNSEFKAIIGLGNPGREYEATRHNLGFWALDILAGRHRFKAGRGNYHSCEIEISSNKIVLLKPITYMNRSGLAVAEFAGDNGVSPSELLVITDDFYLPFGQLRLRKSGSDGGHKGLASIIYHLGTDEISRIRLGVGPVPDSVAAEDFVLRGFDSQERALAEDMARRAAEAAVTWLNDGFEIAAAQFNRALDEN